LFKNNPTFEAGNLLI